MDRLKHFFITLYLILSFAQWPMMIDIIDNIDLSIYKHAAAAVFFSCCSILIMMWYTVLVYMRLKLD